MIIESLVFLKARSPIVVLFISQKWSTIEMLIVREK